MDANGAALFGGSFGFPNRGAFNKAFLVDIDNVSAMQCRNECFLNLGLEGSLVLSGYGNAIAGIDGTPDGQDLAAYIMPDVDFCFCHIVFVYQGWNAVSERRKMSTLQGVTWSRFCTYTVCATVPSTCTEVSPWVSAARPPGNCWPDIG